MLCYFTRPDLFLFRCDLQRKAWQKTPKRYWCLQKRCNCCFEIGHIVTRRFRHTFCRKWQKLKLHMFPAVYFFWVHLPCIFHPNVTDAIKSLSRTCYLLYLLVLIIAIQTMHHWDTICTNTRGEQKTSYPFLYIYIYIYERRTKPITSAKRHGWNGHRFLCVPHRSWGFGVVDMKWASDWKEAVAKADAAEQAATEEKAAAAMKKE